MNRDIAGIYFWFESPDLAMRDSLDKSIVNYSSWTTGGWDAFKRVARAEEHQNQK
jgi:hypothetical protein